MLVRSFVRVTCKDKEEREIERKRRKKEKKKKGKTEKRKPVLYHACTRYRKRNR